MKNTTCFLIFLLIFAFTFQIPFNTSAKIYSQGVCTKPYYKPSDIVGYFYNYALKEALYITYDWCVVKALLWYGTIFGHYSVTADEVEKYLNDIFPERQVYFGLIPGYFFKDGGNYIQRGKFATEQHKSDQTGYFLNDNPFKNIFSGNYPKPPRYVPDSSIYKTYGVATPKGEIAPILMKRMSVLHQFFANYIVKGKCNDINFAQKYARYCDYFAIRTKIFTPSQYFSFDKLPEYNP